MKSHMHIFAATGLIILSSLPLHTADNSTVATFIRPGNNLEKNYPAIITGIFAGLATPFVGAHRAQAKLDAVEQQYSEFICAGRTFRSNVINTSAAKLLVHKAQTLVRKTGRIPKRVAPEKMQKLADAYFNIRTVKLCDNIPQDLETCDKILGGKNKTVQIHNALFDDISFNYHFYQACHSASIFSGLALIFGVIAYYVYDTNSSIITRLEQLQKHIDTPHPEFTATMNYAQDVMNQAAERLERWNDELD